MHHDIVLVVPELPDFLDFHDVKMAKTNKKHKSTNSKTFKQSKLLVPAVKTTVCEICNFAYNKNIKKSREQHDNVHSDHTFGRKIKSKKLLQTIFNNANPKITKNVSLKGKVIKVHAVIVSCVDPVVCSLVEDILTAMNQIWLNSTECSSNWKLRPFQSKVVLLISESEGTFRIIGITTTDSPETDQKYIPGFHLDTSTCEIVCEKPKLQLRLGISRIFVLPTYRGHGLAKMMLDCVLKYSIYGTELHQWQIGFSQPSGAGLQLLKSWYMNSPTLPVYEENA